MNKGIAIAILLLLLSGKVTLAGPPFGTDDPEPVEFHHWEFYISSMNQLQPGNSSGTLPHFETNFGVIKNCQLHIELPLNYVQTAGTGFHYGYGNTELGFKFRFWKNTDESLQIGIFPILEIPTIRNAEFSTNKVQAYLPLWIQKSWGRFTTYGGGGYWINPGPGNTNWTYGGWEAQYDFSKHLTLGSELFFRSSQVKGEKSLTGFNLGGFINFSEKIHLIFSAGHSITGNPAYTTYTGLLITI